MLIAVIGLVLLHSSSDWKTQLSLHTSFSASISCFSLNILMVALMSAVTMVRSLQERAEMEESETVCERRQPPLSRSQSSSLPPSVEVRAEDWDRTVSSLVIPL